MIESPRLKRYLTVFPISEQVWGLRGGSDELWRVKLRGEQAIEVFAAVLPYLDGRHRRSEILDQVRERGLDASAADKLIEHLERLSLLEAADDPLLSSEEEERFRAQVDYFSRFTDEGGGKLQARLRDSRVSVVGGGRFARSLCDQLERSGFGRVTRPAEEPGDPSAAGSANGGPPSDAGRVVGLESAAARHELPDLVFLPQDRHDPRAAEALDAYSNRFRVSWMLLRAVSTREGWVGPLFVPGETATYESLEARLRGNQAYFPEHEAFDRHLREGAGAAAPPLGGLHALYDLLSAIAVIEAVKLLTDVAVPRLAGHFVTIDLDTWESESHRVLRVPRLGLDADRRPVPFPWKEVPYGGAKNPRA